ncbi:hypothetical protein D3C72_1304600 [compost metagenome]
MPVGLVDGRIHEECRFQPTDLSKSGDVWCPLVLHGELTALPIGAGAAAED